MGIIRTTIIGRQPALSKKWGWGERRAQESSYYKPNLFASGRALILRKELAASRAAAAIMFGGWETASSAACGGTEVLDPKPPPPCSSSFCSSSFFDSAAVPALLLVTPQVGWGSRSRALGGEDIGHHRFHSSASASSSLVSPPAWPGHRTCSCSCSCPPPSPWLPLHHILSQEFLPPSAYYSLVPGGKNN